MTTQQASIADQVRALSRFSDVHLNVKKPALSILFPEQRFPDDNMLTAINMLAKQVLINDEAHNPRNGVIQSHSSFMVDFLPEGENGPRLLFRVQPLVRNESYAMRRSNLSVMEYGKDIITPENIDAVLMRGDLARTGGLIVVSGSTGAGKTSLVYSAIIERLKRFGGYCLAIEDPTEAPGAYGPHMREGTGKKGFLAQIDASVRGGYENAIMDGLRSIPITENRPIVFIGEIRDGKTAAEMLRFSISGNLVFTTVHAEDHDAMCQRIISLAKNGGEPDASGLLQRSLMGSINQRMTADRKVQYSSLNINQKIRQAISANNWAEFSSELKQQQQVMPMMTGMNRAPAAKMHIPAER